jgi:hypothetical protein
LIPARTFELFLKDLETAPLAHQFIACKSLIPARSFELFLKDLETAPSADQFLTFAMFFTARTFELFSEALQRNRAYQLSPVYLSIDKLNNTLDFTNNSTADGYAGLPHK